MINLTQALEISKKVCEEKFKDCVPYIAYSYSKYFYINIDSIKNLKNVPNSDPLTSYNETWLKIDKSDGSVLILDLLDIIDDDEYYENRKQVWIFKDYKDFLIKNGLQTEIN